MKEIQELIAKSAVNRIYRGKEYKVLTLESESSISFEIYRQSKKTDNSPSSKVHLFALEAGVIPIRYLDNVINYGIENQIKLLKSTISIVGLGRVGSHVAELFARMGVGHLILIDNETIKDINLSSQSIALPEYISLTNSNIMSLRIRDINPAIKVTEIEHTLEVTNINSLLNHVNLIVSSTSNLETIQLINQFSTDHKVNALFSILKGNVGLIASNSAENDYKASESDFSVDLEESTLPYMISIVAGSTVSEAIDLLLFEKNKSGSSFLEIKV